MNNNRPTLKANHEVNANDIYGKVIIPELPTRYAGTEIKKRYLNDSVRGDQRRTLIRQGKRYIE